MFEELKERLLQGLTMLRSGKEIVEEVGENIGDAGHALSLEEIETLNALLQAVSTESEALSRRIQRA